MNKRVGFVHSVIFNARQKQVTFVDCLSLK